MLTNWLVPQKRTKRLLRKRTDVIENQVKDLLQKTNQKLILMVRQ